MIIRILPLFLLLPLIHSCSSSEATDKNKVDVGQIDIVRNQSANCGANFISGVSSDLLDPNLDGMISTNSSGFSDCKIADANEMAEFETLVNPEGCESVDNTSVSCQKDWTAIPSFAESIGDIWNDESCSLADIVGDGSEKNHFLYYTITDPDGQCNSGDEILVTRLRTAKPANGSFSFSILVDADNAVGNSDPDGVQFDNTISNIGFEYEIVVDPNNAIIVYDINGKAGSYNAEVVSYRSSNNYMQAQACRSACECAENAVYHTFFIKLSDIGKSCINKEFRLAAMTANAVNGVVVSATTVVDIGGAGGPLACTTDDEDACGCCAECAMEASPFYNSKDKKLCINACLAACAVTAAKVDVPVKFQNFIGKKVAQSIQLEWHTEREIMNEYFVIEKSPDGSNFTAFAEIIGRGNSNNLVHYEYVDNNPLPGTNHFRIQQFGSDGESTFSPVIVVEQEEAASVDIYPLVVKDIVTVEVETKKSITIPVFMASLKGEVVLSQTLKIKSGSNEEQIDLSHLDNGLYNMSLDVNGVKKNYKLTISK